MTIPARVHFCWIGTSLPWAYVFAVLSASERSELPEIILHHTDALEEGPELESLKRARHVQLHRVDPGAYLTRAGNALGIGDSLVAVYRSLERPVMRADILRAAILYLEGGVYLDLDTITTSSLRPLLDTPQFVGLEVIVWPQSVRLSRSPMVWARHLTLDLLRKVMRNMPDGWEKFRHIEKFYSRSVANGVMGAEARSSLMTDYLHAMLQVPLEPQPQTYAFGPDLIQDVVGRYAGADVTLHEPHVFYPMPTEISEHWFRINRTVRLDEVLFPETRVVHWYASVRTKSRVELINPAYVRTHRSHQLYSALVCACIQNLPSAR